MANTTTPMAWNEPGGNKKDPWGGKRSDGLPDLDEAVRKIFEKIFNPFKKGGSGGSGGSAAGLSIGFGAIAIIALALYAFAGFYIVKAGEQAVVTRFGKHARKVGAGPHWRPPFIESTRIVNTENVTSSKHIGSMLTEDENIVTVEIEVQYRVVDPSNYFYNVVDPHQTLRQASDSALRQSVGKSKLDFVLTTGRAELAEDIKQLITETLESYESGIFVSTVALKKAEAPAEVKGSFENVIKAREKKVRLKHQAEAYYNKLVPEAKGQAEKLILEANADKESAILRAQGAQSWFDQVYKEYKKAPKVTKIRLYLDAMEEVLENSSKVIVDLESGNNLIYLPIDKLMQSNDRSSSRDAANDARYQTTPGLQQQTNNARNRQLRRRRGEG